MSHTLITIKFPKQQVSSEFIKLLNCTFADAGYEPAEIAGLSPRKGHKRLNDGVPWKSIVTYLSKGGGVLVSYFNPTELVTVWFKYARNRNCEELFLNATIENRSEYSPREKSLLLGLETMALEFHRQLNAYHTEAVDEFDRAQLFCFSPEQTKSLGDLPVRKPYHDENPDDY